MKKLSTRERAYMIVFAVALVWGGWNYRHLFKSDDKAAPGTIAPVAAQTAVAPEPVAPIRVRAAVARDEAYLAPPWSGDPFQRDWRGVTVATQATKTRSIPLNLSAIVVRPNVKYAVINGKIVREGQTIAGRTVTRIEETLVLLDDKGVEVTLSL